METAKQIDKCHIVKQRDGAILLQSAVARYQNRDKPETIVEIGSSTGKNASDIAKLFPTAQVIGIESEAMLVEYSRAHCKQKNLLFITAVIGGKDFWSQVEGQVKEGSVDLVISTHTLRPADPAFDTALENIAKLLKTDGFLFAAISLWSDLLEIERRIALKFPESLTKSQRAKNLVNQPKLEREDEKTQLRAILQKQNLDGQTVLVYSHIKFKTLKNAQDAIKFICPIGRCMPDSTRLQFYGQFFEQVYEEYFGKRSSVHAFEYEYLHLVAHKMAQ